MQRRIAAFGLVNMGIVALFQITGRIVNLSASNLVDRSLGRLGLRNQLLVLVAFVLVWLRARSGLRSTRELRVLDTFATIVPPLMLCFVLVLMPPTLRPELMALLMITNVLMVRAVMIPSSARRTLTLGVVLALTISVSSYLYYLRATGPGLAPRLFYTVSTSLWAAASVVGSTIVSHTIFGLRQKVVAAAQLGQYTLERKIGQGGMGLVYRARHALLRRPTAVKLLLPERSDARDYARFEREVQLTSELTHPNTISIYDYGRTPDGIIYYAMEYLDGLDLQQLIERDGPQTPACAVHVLKQVCGALVEAHEHGLIHRDIKPANVILCERGGQPGVAKVVDFGLVRRLAAGDDPATSTAASIIGTPLYMSPEAIVAPNQIDARSDLYSLGALGYFLLTGVPVFSGQSLIEVCGHQVHSAPVPPSKRAPQAIPDALDALIMQLLSKRPQERPETAVALADRLDVLAAQAPWPRAQAEVWWKRVLSLRDAAPRSSRSLPAGSSETLAIDLRSRGQ